ncbi:MAG: hypothetical protein IJ946_07755 [Clostridia bacterium]|nr:hypothetical protein [Clostridia bacterium]
MNNSINPTEHSTIVSYYKELSDIVGKENLERFLKGDYTYEDNAPFLSVIMRTQGHRPEALSEVLLCLCGQSDMDFEVLIMGHNLDEVGRESVLEIINDLPEFMDGKVSLIEVIGGNRTTPLSRGFEAAKGRYISILDDDDLVFEDWVEAFHTLEKDNSGKILHTYCVAQDWLNVKNDYDETVLVSVSPFRTIYCTDFELIRQLSQNYCPTFSLAFPSIAYKLLGIHFDEALTTTEDWDFLMRTALICGVADNPTITGIYRMWINAENSATLHNKKEWDKNHKYIQNKFKSSSIIVPKGDTDDIIAKSCGDVFASKLNTNEFTILVDDGSGFMAHRPLSPEFSGENGIWHARCTEFGDFDKVKSIRIDPLVSGTMTIKTFRIKANDDNGNDVTLNINKFRTNGVFYKDMVVFLGDDPQIRYDVKNPVKLSSVVFEFQFFYDVPVGFMRMPILRFTIKHWAAAIFRKLRAILRLLKPKK